MQENILKICVILFDLKMPLKCSEPDISVKSIRLCKLDFGCVAHATSICLLLLLLPVSIICMHLHVFVPTALHNHKKLAILHSFISHFATSISLSLFLTFYFSFGAFSDNNSCSTYVVRIY